MYHLSEDDKKLICASYKSKMSFTQILDKYGYMPELSRQVLVAEGDIKEDPARIKLKKDVTHLMIATPEEGRIRKVPEWVEKTLYHLNLNKYTDTYPIENVLMYYEESGGNPLFAVKKQGMTRETLEKYWEKATVICKKHNLDKSPFFNHPFNGLIKKPKH